MTVLTKPSQLIQKADVTRIPVVQDVAYDCPYEEDSTDVEVAMTGAGQKRRSQSPSAVLFLGVLALLVVSAGFLCGTELYAQYLRTGRQPPLRYQGFCTIPVDRRGQQEPTLIEPFYRVIPLRFYEFEDEVTTTAVEDLVDTEDMNALQEEFEIGDTVEKISVFNAPQGRPASYIHDFMFNVSGIVDSERCFVMSLDRSLALPPAVLVASIARGAAFDVSRVRETLRALLPPLAPLPAVTVAAPSPGPPRIKSPALDALCADLPVYKLEKVDAIIRKRSANSEETAEAQYTQFAGRRVRDTLIHNMDEILKYEAAAQQ